MASKAQNSYKKRTEEQERAKRSKPSTRNDDRLRPNPRADSGGAQRSDRPQGMAANRNPQELPPNNPIRGNPPPARPGGRGYAVPPQYGSMPQRPATGPAPSTGSAIQQALMRSSPQFRGAQGGATVPIPPRIQAQAAPITIPPPIQARPVPAMNLPPTPATGMPPSPGNPIQPSMAYAGPVLPGEPRAGPLPMNPGQVASQPITIPPPQMNSAAQGGMVLPGEPGAGPSAPPQNLLGGPEDEIIVDATRAAQPQIGPNDFLSFLGAMGIPQAAATQRIPQIQPPRDPRSINVTGSRIPYRY